MSVNKHTTSLDLYSNDGHLNISRQRIAILVNDMPNDFIYGALKSDRASKIITQIRDLVSVARKEDVPVFYCNDELVEKDPELKIWGPHSMKGTDGSKVIRELDDLFKGII